MNRLYTFVLLLVLTGCDGVLIGEVDTDSDGTNTENVTDTDSTATGSDLGDTESVHDGDFIGSDWADTESVSDGDIIGSDWADTESGDGGELIGSDWADTESVSDGDIIGSDWADTETGDGGELIDSELADTETVSDGELIDSELADTDSVQSGDIGTRCPTAGYCDAQFECRFDFFYERRVCTRSCNMSADDCPEGSVCVDNIPDFEDGVVGPYCLRPCERQSECESILGSDCDTYEGLLGRYCF